MIVKINELLKGEVTIEELIDNRDVVVEVGFGNGDFMLWLAKKYFNSVIIGIEISAKSVEKLYRKIQKNGVENVKIINGDAKLALSFFPLNSIRLFYCNFPDPWWKKRHKKRRLFTPEFIEMLYSRMAPGGVVEICTDHIEYAGFILRNFENTKIFLPGYGRYPLVNCALKRFRTKYERKFLLSGKTICYFRFVKLQNESQEGIAPSHI